MKLAILGPPGAGKTTQAEILSRVLELDHIHMGQILRIEAQSDSPMAEQIRYSLSRGMLAPEDTVIALLAREIAESGDDYILDGVPRTLGQALGLEYILTDEGESLDAVISLEITTEEIVRRLTYRGRGDDRQDLILHRLRIFEDETHPVLSYYEDRGILVPVPADGSAESVASRILHALRERSSSKAA